MFRPSRPSRRAPGLRACAYLAALGSLVAAAPSRASPVDELYRRWSYKDFQPDTSTMDTDRLLANAGVRDGDLIMGRVPNPDPSWIRGWRRNLPSWEYSGMLAQAAINRTWEPACVAAFADYRAKWTALENQFRPRLAELAATGNYYQRAMGLFELLAEVDAAARAAGAVLADKHWSGDAGFRFEIVKAIVALHRDTHHGAFIADWYKQVGGRALSPDVALERNIFCHAATRLGTHRTPALTVVKPVQANGVEALQADVRWPACEYTPIPETIDAFLARAGAEARVALTLDVPVLDALVPQAPVSKGQVVRVALLVGAARTEGRRLTLQLALERWSTVKSSGCTETKQIDHVGADGRFVYRIHCKNVGVKTTEEQVVVTIDDLPASVIVRKGDWVRAIGVVAGEHATSTRREVRLEHGYLLEVSREGKQLMTVAGPPAAARALSPPRAQPRID